MSPERRQFRSTAVLKNNYHAEGHCVCCMNHKGKEEEGRVLKLHRLTVDKALRKVRWSPLSETGQKSDSMFATIICTALYKAILFTLFPKGFFQYPDAFKNWGGGVYLKRIHNKITKPMCYHYCYSATDNDTCGQILALTVSAVCV